jgi:hypothetical protein
MIGQHCSEEPCTGMHRIPVSGSSARKGMGVQVLFRATASAIEKVRPVLTSSPDWPSLWVRRKQRLCDGRGYGAGKEIALTVIAGN